MRTKVFLLERKRFMNKAELRLSIKKGKLNISHKERESASILVMNKIETLTQFKEAKNILLYNALPDELPTDCMLEKWNGSKEIFLPVVVDDNLVIKKYNKKLLRVGAFGIFEPEGDEVEIGLIDLIIVPGVAFDRHLNRLGRGKGYYDRLLTNSNAYFIGIGYDMQVVDSITTEPHDIKMNCIITEREIL